MCTSIRRVLGLGHRRTFDAAGGGRRSEQAKTVESLNAAILAGVTVTVCSDFDRGIQRKRPDMLLCSHHATANGRISTASVRPAGCRPSRIASTMSGASRVRRRTRLT